MTSTSTTTGYDEFGRKTLTLVTNGWTTIHAVESRTDPRNGKVTVTEGTLNLLSFEHPNPFGAARTIQALIDSARHTALQALAAPTHVDL